MMDVTTSAVEGRDSPWVKPLVIGGTVLVVVAFASMLVRGRPTEVIHARWLFHNAPTAVAALWLGYALKVRRPGHGLGTLFLVVGTVSALHVAVISLADARLVAAGVTGAAARIVPADLPLDATVPLWISSWLWLPAPVLTGTLFLLLFPDGRFPSRRWRPLLPITGLGLLAVLVAYGVAGWPTSSRAMEIAQQPTHTPFTGGLAGVGGALILVATLASVASLVVRWRGAAPDVRRQFRIVGIAAVITAVVLVGLFPWQAVWIPASLVAINGFLATYTVAVLRNRLHDLDVVINRTVVASVLAALVTGAYLAVVVGIGSLVGRGAANPILPLLAVGIVAVLFEPARRRVRQIVDRLLYNRDADAYEVLSELSGQLREAGSIDAVTQRVTLLLVRGTGASGARITIEQDGRRESLAAIGEPIGEDPVHVADIVHNGERLGEVALFARSEGDLAPDAPALLVDVAGTLGAVVRNAILTGQLEERVEDLRRSRRRLVTAQDEARRELERDIHDGAQARLVALRIQLGMAATLAETGETDRLAALIDQLGEVADDSIRSLRNLSRGLSPPLLDSGGITAALRAGVRGLPLDVRIDADGIGRYAAAVEAAVYFSCLEAVNNAATHSRAEQVSVALTNGTEGLRFVVEDDGEGFDPRAVHRGRGLDNLADRVNGLHGTLTIDAAPGRGTRIIGELPVSRIDVDERPR